MIREAIQKEINDRKMKQSTLSELSGVSKNSICQYLKGNTELREPSIDKLCKALDLTIIKEYK